MKPELAQTMSSIYQRGRLSFLQYVKQATPYASAADRPVVDRMNELAQAESIELDQLAEYLDHNRVNPPKVGAFPTEFTNYNYVAVRKLLPGVFKDESSGLESLERDVAKMPAGEERSLIEKLTTSKRTRLDELQKLAN